jgi:hypothetical protein
MASRMFSYVAFALMAPASDGCLERALLHVGIQLEQIAGQLLAILLDVCLAHEELASLHGAHALVHSSVQFVHPTIRTFYNRNQVHNNTVKHYV